MKARINSFTAVAHSLSDTFIRLAPTREILLGLADEATRHSLDSTGMDVRTTHLDDQGGIILGGRSMGARAAVLTATSILEASSPATKIHLDKRLVLVSYPLINTKGDKRDQILLDLPSDFSVLFIIGTRDTMCPLDELEVVRNAMKAKSWLVRVEDANHGMETKPKKMMKEVVEETGRAAGEWLAEENALNAGMKDMNAVMREARIWVQEDAEEEKHIVKWSGWVEKLEELPSIDEEEVEDVGKDKSVKKKPRNSSAKKDTNDEPVDKEPAKTKTKQGGQTPVKKQASTGLDMEKSKPRKRKSATSQQDDSSPPDKKQHTRSREPVTPSRANAQADPSSVASRTRSKQKAA